MNPYTPDIWSKSYAPGVSWDAEIRIYPVSDLLDVAHAKYGDKPAFDYLGKRYTWTELATAANHVAKGFQERGLQKGDRVALMLPNCPFYAACYYGILKAGGIIVNLNPLYAEREVKHHIDDSGAKYLVTLDLEPMFSKAVDVLHQTKLENLVVCRFVDVLPFPKNLLFPVIKWKDIAADAHNGDYLAFDELTHNDGIPAAVPIDPANDIALLQYTGGTTGVPKAAALTHANITANVEQCRLWFPEASEGDGKMLGVIPFFHAFSMTAVLNFGVRLGWEIIATPKFDVEETLKIISKKKPKLFPAVPAIYNAIAQKAAGTKYDLSSIQYCVSGGAPLPVEVKKTFEDLTGAVVVEGYGLSETSPVVCVNPTAGSNAAGSIGLPVCGTVVEIVSLEDGVTLMPLGEKGELCVRGPQVMKEYWNKPDETAAVLRDGRLHTGDVATMDTQGYVRIVDRIKDMIIVNGFKVYPRNVEDVIYQYGGVAECIVAGVPDPQRGEMVKAWVHPKAGVTLDAGALKAFLKEQLTPTEVPRAIEISDTPLPKTLIGKLSRKDVAAKDRAG
ncbi:MAG: long-chain fatty acid--CoA ligase [Alphaproteobacteria bacterium]|nr:long-chain fatty acid--CoA ligase [Alphaproteobacteria bacterium]